MHDALYHLIKEAEHLVVPASHGQRPSDHHWVPGEGGRGCPRAGDGSQTLYECQLCGDTDYGDPGGPGFSDCFSSPEGCEGCFTLEAQLDFPSVGEWVPLEQYRRSITSHG